MSKIFFVALTTVFVLILGGCDNQDKKDGFSKIKDKGEIVIGIDDSFVPMGFRDKNGSIIGFDIDLARRVLQDENLSIKFQPIDWSMKETELKNGTIDLIWNGYSVTNERKKEVIFSAPYLNNKQVLIALKDSGISSFKDMQGKKLGVQEGSSSANALENNPELLKDFIDKKTPIFYDSFVEAFMDLKNGRINGLIIDQVFADYYIAHDTKKVEYLVMDTQFSKENYAVGLRKEDTELLKVINDGLQKAYNDGSSQQISQKWFGQDDIIKPNLD